VDDLITAGQRVSYSGLALSAKICSARSWELRIEKAEWKINIAFIASPG